MILAVASCAEFGTPPPPELMQAWQVERWGTLPEPGGLRDQRAGEMERLTMALNVYRAVRDWSKATTGWVKWKQDNPEAWRIVTRVLKLRQGA